MINKLLLTLLAGLASVPISARCEQTAQARLYCLSLRFQHGSDSTTEYSLDLEDGELWPYDISSHAAYIKLNDDWFGDSTSGYFLLPIPTAGDANANGFDDFFESVQPVGATSTSGSYSLSGLGSGTLDANWSRPAGSTFGTCILKFKPAPFYTWLTFSLTFQLLEYKGTLSYLPAISTVTGNINLSQTDAPDMQLLGPVAFAKQSADRFNLLTLLPGAWTNASQQTLVYTNSVFDRDTSCPTNYYGYVIFDDFDLNSTSLDYWAWVLSIDDSLDSNANGIPDFSDDPSTAPRAPQLSLARGTSDLRLTILGDVGHTHDIQTASSLPATNWVTIWSGPLTNAAQVVSLPLPSAPATFWRVVAH